MARHYRDSDPTAARAIGNVENNPAPRRRTPPPTLIERFPDVFKGMTWRESAKLARTAMDLAGSPGQISREHLEMARIASAEPIICPTCGTPTSPWTCSCGETRVSA